MDNHIKNTLWMFYYKLLFFLLHLSLDFCASAKILNTDKKSFSL